MSIEQFLQVYHDNLQVKPTAYLAYVETESTHVQKVGIRKYANYETFRAAKSRHLKAISNKKIIERQNQIFQKMIKYVPSDEAQKFQSEWNKSFMLT